MVIHENLINYKESSLKKFFDLLMLALKSWRDFFSFAIHRILLKAWL